MKPPQLRFGFAPEGSKPTSNKEARRRAQTKYKDSHRAQLAAARIAVRQQRIASGKCPCGRGPPVPGGVTCQQCRDHFKVKARNEREARTARDKAKYTARKAAGLCIETSCNLRAVSGRTRCETHRVAQNRRGTEHSRRHPEKKRAIWLKHRYGIAVAEWDRMFEAQGRRCAICGSDNLGSKQWHVDHDHSTGKIRAILCNCCNTGIGMFRDDPSLLSLAIEYLRKHKLTLVV